MTTNHDKESAQLRQSTQTEGVSVREFCHLMLVAAKAVSEESVYLDTINVFPVADGDTGLNMSATLAHVQADISLFEEYTFAALSDTIMNSLLLHSRGNSGTALTQFFKGLLIVIASSNGLTPKVWQEAFESARSEIWKSFDTPQSGTILDVADALALVPPQESLWIYFDKLDIAATDAMNKTKKIHPLLKKSEVVDSGAAGLAIIIKAWRELLHNDFEIQGNHHYRSTPMGFSGKPEHLEVNDEYQYCTEIVVKVKPKKGLISHDSLNDVSQKIKLELNDLGGYVQVVGYKNLVKAHVHTNYPDRVKEIVSKYGERLEFKADDMIVMQQNRIAQDTSNTNGSTVQSKSAPFSELKVINGFIFVTDSSVDYDDSKNKPATAHLELFNYDGENLNQLDPNTYYQRMESEEDFRPKSSKPPEGVFLGLFKAALERDPNVRVISITISSKLSATFNGAVKAREAIMESDGDQINANRIIVIDSLTASAGISMLINELQSVIAPDWTEDKIRDEAENIQQRISTYFVVDDMKYLRRNGRISQPVSLVGKVLNMSPVLTLKTGSIIKHGSPILFADREKQVRKLESIIKDHMNLGDKKSNKNSTSSEITSNDSKPPKRSIKKIHIVYAGNNVQKEAQDLKEYAIKLGMKPKDVACTLLNTLIGTHTGPGSFGLFILRQKE